MKSQISQYSRNFPSALNRVFSIYMNPRVFEFSKVC